MNFSNERPPAFFTMERLTDQQRCTLFAMSLSITDMIDYLEFIEDNAVRMDTSDNAHYCINHLKMTCNKLLDIAKNG